MAPINIDHIRLGEPVQSGHTVYPQAVYGFNQSKPVHMVVKKNKYNNPQFSRLEVGFSQLARLFLAKGLTAKQQLVADKSNAIWGVASTHMHHVIAEHEGLPRFFYELNDLSSTDCSPLKTSKSEDIPLYFFDQLPHGFFAQLLQAEQAGKLKINYSSLASILTSSYTLEEDDLHKGNFGFYLTEKEGKPEAVFIKIDHDLMLTEEVMSFHSMRLQQIFLDEHAFDVTAEDLLHFPDVRCSANTYWPTKNNPFLTPWSSKSYRDRNETDAFASLNKIPAFNKAKWLSFYKHILIPTELTELVLSESLDKDKAKERARVALMSQAMSARQSQLRTMLCSLPEFRNCVNALSKHEEHSLINDLVHSCPPKDKERMTQQVTQALTHLKQMIHNKEFEEGDTPLHVAIKLGDFRCEETMSRFGHYVNTKNKAGKTPLDVALERVYQSEAHPGDLRCDLRLTMKYLLQHGAVKTEAFNRFNRNERIESYSFQSAYITKVQQARSYLTLKTVLRDIGENHHYCLKFKKKLAVQCIKEFISNNRHNLDLSAYLKLLKKEMNNEIPEFQYIRQLRSHLWIVRQIRGLYGWTTTQGEINELVKKSTNELNASPQHKFFNHRSKPSSAEDQNPDDFSLV